MKKPWTSTDIFILFGAGGKNPRETQAAILLRRVVIHGVTLPVLTNTSPKTRVEAGRSI